MKKTVIRIIVIALIVVISLMGMACKTTITDSETKKYITDLEVIKQEFLDKLGEQGISQTQRTNDLKDIRIKLIGLGNPDNKDLQDAQEFCLAAMEKDINAANMIIMIMEGQKSGKMTPDQQNEMFKEALKIESDALNYFGKAQIIINKFES